MSKFITDTKKDTLEEFFKGHTQPEVGDEQHYKNFSIELNDFCMWFFEKFGPESDRLLSEFLGTCRADYEKQLHESETQFDCPLVWHDNCLYNSPRDRGFVDEYGDFDKLDEHLELAAQKLTDAINEELEQKKPARLTGFMEAVIDIFDIDHDEVNNDSCHMDIMRFFSYSQRPCSQLQLACLLSLKQALDLDSLELAKDVLAVFLITHYETELTSTVYNFSSKSEYTRRQLHGIQGAYKKVANALAAIDRASKDGNEPKEDAIKHLNDISAKFAAILNMTPVSSNTEGESS
ncbi:hypothetical protein [Idiomarina abyssalis]|uniref:hypothetical protein n=1 Tax=Idiomarina abyssalis TaxID=86102 RepID=UPI001C9462AA|nr:hypothetical protein [Idiomarina abyssalis]QZN92021.1 hypothetical protein K5X84_05845 [Idiomarina abyssalis]